MRRIIWGILAVVAALSHVAEATQFLYIVDKSGSMQPHFGKVTQAVEDDIHASISGGPRAPFNEGDKIHIWAFDAEVAELISAEFRKGKEQAVEEAVKSKMRWLRAGGMTDIGKVLQQALKRFESEKDNLQIFLYTDGDDTITHREFEDILAQYLKNYEKGNRLAGVFVVDFSNGKINPSIAPLVGDKGLPGMVIPEKDLTNGVGVAQIQQAVRLIKITVSPRQISLTVPKVPESVRIVPLDIKVDPPKEGMTLGLQLDRKALPEGMGVELASDRVATDGRQSLAITVTNPQVGSHNLILKLISVGTVDPPEIPLTVTVEPEKSGIVDAQFQPASLNRVELPADGAWHKVPDLLFLANYPEKEKTARAVFKAKILPPGIDLRVLPDGDEQRSLLADQESPLAGLGKVTYFALKQTATESVDKDLDVPISFEVLPGQNLTMQGGSSVTVPVRFVRPLTVTVITRQVNLGSVLKGTPSVKRNVEMDVSGAVAGATVRFVKKGQGLAGISLAPAEIPLQSGKTSVEVSFGGFESLAAGTFKGAFEVVPGAKAEQIVIAAPVVEVEGTVPQPATIRVEVVNSMVAGAPLSFHAQLDPKGKGTLHATVRTPESRKVYDISLLDDGSAANGDRTANDDIYSGVFKPTTDLGGYGVTVSGQGPVQGVQESSLFVPVYFRLKDWSSVPPILKKQGRNSPTVTAKIESDYQSPVRIRTETDPAGLPFQIVLHEDALKPGVNTIPYDLTPSADCKPGLHSFRVVFVTDPIEGKSARIAIPLDVKVLSFFAYCMRIVGLVIAGLLLILLLWVLVLVPVLRSMLWPRGFQKGASLILPNGKARMLNSVFRAVRWKTFHGLFDPRLWVSVGGAKTQDMPIEECDIPELARLHARGDRRTVMNSRASRSVKIRLGVPPGNEVVLSREQKMPLVNPTEIEVNEAGEKAVYEDETDRG